MAAWFFDVSNHQFTTPSLEGWDGLIVKASEGNNFRDERFWQHINVAREQGKIHAGYHFLRSDASIKEQVDTFASVCPTDIAAVPDVEWIKDKNGRIVSAPTLSQTREFVDRLRDKGYHVPMMYLPRWYYAWWGGSQSLEGLPALWGSYYPDYTVRPRDQAWSMIPDSAKQGFGGLPMVAVQFTSSPLDQNRSDYTPQQFYDFMSTTRRVDMPLNADTDYPALLTMLQRAFSYDLRPKGAGADWNLGPTIYETFAILMAKNAADVDEAVLAEELAKRGMTGLSDADVAKIKGAMGTVLAGTHLTPPASEGTNP